MKFINEKGSWITHLPHFTFRISQQDSIPYIFNIFVQSKLFQTKGPILIIMQNLVMNFYLILSSMQIVPEKSSSWVSLAPPSFGNRSGAPYHFLNFGPPYDISLCISLYLQFYFRNWLSIQNFDQLNFCNYKNFLFCSVS